MGRRQWRPEAKQQEHSADCGLITNELMLVLQGGEILDGGWMSVCKLNAAVWGGPSLLHRSKAARLSTFAEVLLGNMSWCVRELV